MKAKHIQLLLKIALSGAAVITLFALVQIGLSAPEKSKGLDPQTASPETLNATSVFDLHLAATSPMVDMEVDVGVTRDIGGLNRVAAPDIGVDEPSGVTPPANDIAATAIINPPNQSMRSAGLPFRVQASFTNAGTASQTNVPVRFKILDTGSNEVYNHVGSVASIDPSQTITVTFSNATLAIGSYMTKAIAELAGDPNSANDVICGNLTVLAPLCGKVTVGTGGNYESLTNPGGLFDAINGAGLSCNLDAVIISDLMNETGAVALNQLVQPGPIDVPQALGTKIRPPGQAEGPGPVPPFVISGSNPGALIKINGADSVTIDGSVSGAAPSGVVGGDPSLRHLTFQNTDPSTSSAVIAVMEGTDGAQDVTIKNVNVIGAGPTQTFAAIHIGGNTVGTPPANHNNNNTRVENCSLQKAVVGVFDDGISPANAATGSVITLNDLAGTGANRLGRVGILMFNQNGVQITENSIGGISTDESADAIGIAAGIQDITSTASASGGVFNANISRNKINGVVGTNPAGSSAAGIAIAGDTAGMNTIANNMIAGVTAPSTSPDIVAGIFVVGVTGSNTKVYFNSIALTGDRIATSGEIGSYGVAISGANTPLVDLKDNIFYTTQTSSGGGGNAKSYVLGTEATATTMAMANLTSNFNLFFFEGANAAGFRTGSLGATGTDFATLAGWQSASGKDAASRFGDPLFVSAANELHIACGSPAANFGVPIAGIAGDFDGQPRSLMTPDIGADEQIGPSPIQVVSRKVHGAAGTFDIALPCIEPRSGDGLGSYQVVFTFPSPVTVSSAAVTSGTGTVSMPSGGGTNTITVDLTGVTDAQCINVTLICVSDGIISGDISVQMCVLLGDVTGNGSVNASDTGSTKSQAGQQVTGVNFRTDVNVNGAVTATDIGLVKSRAGSFIP